MLASKLTTGLTTGVDTNWREDIINFGVGSAQMGVMRHFWKARQLLQIPYGYSLAHAASRNLLLQEGFAYV